MGPVRRKKEMLCARLTRINPPEVYPPLEGGQAGWRNAGIPFNRGNSKLQISNAKQITMTEIQNPKREYDADEAQGLIQETNELKNQIGKYYGYR
jgi:hypothetical protein